VKHIKEKMRKKIMFIGALLFLLLLLIFGFGVYGQDENLI